MIKSSTVTRSLDATSVFHQYVLPSSLSWCGSGIFHPQAAANHTPTMSNIVSAVLRATVINKESWHNRSNNPPFPEDFHSNKHNMRQMSDDLPW